MPRIVVLGGGICGLATAMMLARDGNDVTVLERDPEPVPGSCDEAWESWARRGVAQFRQPHYVHAAHASRPRSGAARRRAMRSSPTARAASIRSPPSPRRSPTARRGPATTGSSPSPPAARRFERAFARAAEDEPGVEVRRGVGVDGVLPGPRRGDGVLHVAGVRTADGEEIHADLVVDAMGRRSKLPALARRGRRARRARGGRGLRLRLLHAVLPSATLPELRAPLNMPIGSISILTLPGDRGHLVGDDLRLDGRPAR